jgi:hypothetical protein
MISGHQKLPLSLFSNTGQKENSALHHYNGWIPNEVGQNILSNMPVFQLLNNTTCPRKPTSRLWSYWNQSWEAQICLIVVWQPMPRLEKYHIHVAGKTANHIELVLDADDLFNVDKFTYTCIVMSVATKSRDVTPV